MSDIKRKGLNGTDLIHGDSAVSTHGSTKTLDVVPPISVSTTFRSVGPDEGDLNKLDFWNPEQHVYSRYSRDTTTRVEHVLSKINHGYALTYASGLAASYAAFVHFAPKRIAIRRGYMGVHASIEVYKQSPAGKEVQVVDLDDEFVPGDLCWLETPVNPTGESRDIRSYADRIHRVGGKLIVDSTFAPPPLQYPFDFGADCVLHSATKYFGGHSDLLAGVLIVKTKEEWSRLHINRIFLGSAPGTLESWLLLRSLRTLHVRIARQADTATKLVQWLKKLVDTPVGNEFDGVPGGIVTTVFHSSIQSKGPNGFTAEQQMTGGWNAAFAILLTDTEAARHLPHQLKYFVAATSLGSVESLVEHRLRGDANEDPTLVRISVGVEDFEDLKDDLRQGLLKIAKGRSGSKL